MPIKFVLSDTDLKLFLDSYKSWILENPLEKEYVEKKFPGIIYNIQDKFLAKGFWESDKDVIVGILYKYILSLDGPVYRTASETLLDEKFESIKKAFLYIIESSDLPLEKAKMVMDGDLKIAKLSKSFWSPIFQARYPEALPNWNNKTEDFLAKIVVDFENFPNRYEIISEAFVYFKNLDNSFNFSQLNHLMHYGTAIKEGGDLLKRMLKKTAIGNYSGVSADKIKELVDIYLKQIEKIGIEEHLEHEKDKFEFVANFQKHFNLEAEDLGKMLNEALSNGHLTSGRNYLPKTMLLYFIKENKGGVRTALKNLFDESESVVERIDEFENFCSSEITEKNKKESRTDSSYINLRFISLLRACRYPEKYFYVKAREYGLFAGFIDQGFSSIGRLSSGEQYEIYSGYANKLNEYIKNIAQVKDIRSAFIEGVDFKDDEYRMTTQDLIFISSREIGEEQEENYWQIATGESGENWEEFQKDGIITIGWDDLGDLKQYNDRKEILHALSEKYPQDGEDQPYNAKSCDFFANDIKIGDYVFARMGRHTILGFGKIVSEYLFDNSRLKYKHEIKVEWIKTGEWTTDFFMQIRSVVKINDDKINKLKLLVMEKSLSKTWIFQGNPKRFNIIEYLEKGGEADWSANQHWKEMSVGDPVYFWVAGEKAGIYALGEIISLPEERAEDDNEKEFGDRKVGVKINKYLGEKYVSREVFLTNDILKNCSIITFANASNFVLTEDESNELLKILNIMPNQSKNLILYGPPGTGKTFFARQEAEKVLSGQVRDESREERIQKILENTTWIDVMGIIMLLRGKEKYKVPEMVSDEIALAVAKIKNRISKLNPTFWGLLQFNADEKSQTVNFSKRSGLNVFDKDEKSNWFLTEDGKEYFNEEKIKNIIEQLRDVKTERKNWDEFYQFITFHQSYSYEDFIEGIRPVLNDGNDGDGLNYELVDGVFKSFCLRAAADPENKYVFVIDEINRGNISKIFGELITLVEDDKRGIPVLLPYSKEKFSVPENVYIWGTMNTADRSIALLDIALRRRFEFEAVSPDATLIKNSVDGLDLAKVLKKLNKKIEIMIDRDHCIGHSYLMKVISKEDLHAAWYKKIVPLLCEYFYNDWDKLSQLLGDYKEGEKNGFVKTIKEVEIKEIFGDAAEEYLDSDNGEIFNYQPKELIEVLKKYVE